MLRLFNNPNIRLGSLFIVFLFAFLALAARLFFWQVIRGSDLSSQARSQYDRGASIQAPRGSILASDGGYLAARSAAWLLFAALPDLTEEPRRVAEKLAPFFIEMEEGEDGRQILLDEIERITSLLSKEEVVWVPIKRKLDTKTKENIEALSIKGLGFEAEEDRVYPEASAAAHLLGFVGKNEEGNDLGYFGLEGYYDVSLSGRAGFVSEERDARGVPILIGGSQEILPSGGVNLVTHIDKSIQLSLEKRLAEGIGRYGAVGGTAIVMDPKNGAILGMSSFPSYEPSEYFDYSNEFFKNPAVSDTFEPGSVFKVLVMAAGLDSGVIKPDTKCEICEGPLKVDKYTIRTWNNEYDGERTMTDVIVNSDNVGMAYVGQKLGADSLYDYLSAFGIGSLTGVDLQGEATGKLRDRGTWNIVDLSTTSFGQGVSVTPLQMLRAVGAIANKGVISTPQAVDKLIGETWQEDIKPVFGQRVISEEAAGQITAMMAEAARNGEAKWTHTGGFKVAGKTGTAQIPIAGHYDEDKTIASFVGFAPYDDPEFVMLVTLKEPQTSPWASETAAPLWYTIARDLFVHFRIQPEN